MIVVKKYAKCKPKTFPFPYNKSIINPKKTASIKLLKIKIDKTIKKIDTYNGSKKTDKINKKLKRILNILFFIR